MTFKPWPVTALEGAKRKLREEADKQLSKTKSARGVCFKIS
jgi:hypothetical protein